MSASPAPGRIIRLVQLPREALTFTLDGVTQQGFQGDTVLTAVLSVTAALRQSEFGLEQRAGFCLMGACQDCWIWQEDGPRLRACSTPLVQGMRLRRAPPMAWP